MEGTKEIDELMCPVKTAIERHVKDRTAFTDIYNRAYEALMISMDAKAGETYCSYCGARFPLDDQAASLVGEHIRMCEKHPMRAIEREVGRLRAALEKADHDAEQLFDALNECHDRHNEHCDFWRWGKPCDCGSDAALAEHLARIDALCVGDA